MYYPQRYPFTINRSSQCAVSMVESEMHFEGFATYHHDEDTEMAFWEVESVCTGFTQYKDGKVLSSVTDIKTNKWQVSDLSAFEADCVDKAINQFQLKTGLTMEEQEFLAVKAELEKKMIWGDKAKAAAKLNKDVAAISQWFAAKRFTQVDDVNMAACTAVVNERKSMAGNLAREAIAA